MNMPIKADVEDLNKQGGGGSRSASILYAPLPVGQHATTKVGNKIFFGLFSPAKWSLFQQDNHILKKGALPDGLWTFYFKLVGHYVDSTDSLGKNRSQFILCPTETNKYLVDVLKYQPLFKDGRCRYCEENKAWWAKFENRWATSKLDGSALNPDRWGYDKDTYKKILSQNPDLNQIKDEAGKWQAGPRWVFQVFDMAKLALERPFDEGENQVDYQFYLGPKTVFEGLNNLAENGIAFYDADKPQQILLTKDCTEGGPRQAKYTVLNLGPLPVNPEEMAYLQDDNSLPDMPWGAPFSEGTVLCVQSYDEMVSFKFGVPTSSHLTAPTPTQTVQGNSNVQVGGSVTAVDQPAVQPVASTTAGAQPTRRRGNNSW